MEYLCGVVVGRARAQRPALRYEYGMGVERAIALHVFSWVVGDVVAEVDAGAGQWQVAHDPDGLIVAPLAGW